MALDANSLGVLTNLGVGAAVFVSVLIAFDLLRYFFPAMYYYREAASRDPCHANYDATPLHALPRPSHLPFAWIVPTLRYPESATIATHGLDVAMYLRFLSTQAKLFAVLTVLTAVVLYPTYITASNRDLPLTDARRPVGIEIASLSNVPDRSDRLWVTLVCEVFVVATVLFFLYRDMAAYTRYRRRYRADGRSNPSNFAVLVQDIPEPHRSLPDIFNRFDRIFPGTVVAVHQVRDAQSLRVLKQKYLKVVTKRERAEWDAAATGAEPTISVAEAARATAVGPEEMQEANADAEIDAIAHWRREQAALKKQIVEKEDFLDDTAPLTGAAIVVFGSKRIATFAATAPFSMTAGNWRISRAPEPKSVNWDRLDISKWTTRIRAYATFGALTALALLWTIPAGLIQALDNLEEFGKRFDASFLANFVRDNPDFTKFLEGILPPLLLFLVLLLIPLVMRFVVSFERIHSLPLVESKIRNYLFLFYVMSNFVYVLVFGSFFKELEAILANPANIISFLSSSVPGQATFLMKYVLINAFLGSVIGLLNVGRLLIRPLTMRNARTTREKRNGDGVFAQYPFGKLYALCAMISLISVVYSTIAPIICLVALTYFCIAYLCTKHLLLYSHRPLFEGGGVLFRDACTQLLVGLFVHQVSMIGIFILKRAVAQAIVSGLSFVFSIWFTLYVRRAFFFRAKHGSLMDQYSFDEEHRLVDRVPETFADMYIHPGLKPLHEVEELGTPLEGSPTLSRMTEKVFDGTDR